MWLRDWLNSFGTKYCTAVLYIRPLLDFSERGLGTRLVLLNFVFNISELLCMDKMLQDRLIWAIKDDSIQKKLLQEKDFSTSPGNSPRVRGSWSKFERNEGTKAELDFNREGIIYRSVHEVSKRNPNTTCMGVTCPHCGTPGHLATVCKFQDHICHKCGKRGHLVKVCWRSNPRHPPPGAKPKRPGSQPVRQVGEETDSGDSMQLIQTLEGQEGYKPPIKVHVG